MAEEVEVAHAAVTAAIKAKDGTRSACERKLLTLRSKLRDYQRWCDGLVGADS